MYLFITGDDLRTTIYQRFIDESKSDFEERVEKIEKQRIAFIKSKIAERYDVNSIFETTGEDRHELLLKYLCDMIVFDLIRTNATRKVPADFMLRYTDAKKWFQDIRDGKESPYDLPVLTEASPSLWHGSSRNDNFYL